jgi:small-conductance mechanosensitive channel
VNAEDTIKTLQKFSHNEIENIAQNIFSEYGWIVAVGIIALLSKDLMMNFVQGILVFLGSGFNNDDIIYLSGRQARIVRVGIRNTTFYMTDRKTKMVVPNEQLKQLVVEKTLPKNGGVAYKPKGGEPGFEDIVEIKLKDLPPNLQKKFRD